MCAVDNSILPLCCDDLLPPGTNVSTYVVHPGLSRTELGRHMNMNQSYLSSSILGPFWSLIFKTPDEAIQTAMKCALDPELEKESGKFYMFVYNIKFLLFLAATNCIL